MNRARVWAPFAIALVSELVLWSVYDPVCHTLGWYNPFLGCMKVGLMAGAPIGLVAGIVSRTWRGVLTLCLGFLAFGALVEAFIWSGDPGSLLKSSLYMLFEQGVLGVPTYLVVTAAISALKWLIACGRTRRSRSAAIQCQPV
ncbi:MAG TPA: hypothetical protein VFN41_13445 [Candidatus Limnocylindrales bacterium]|nr:hypothetical protein [Candidatus Limnocylindrales bacterium]